MLTNFEVTNYRTFNGMVRIDFSDINKYQMNDDCIYDGVISKMLIYGRNSTGKTNLGRAILNIASMIGSGLKEPSRSLLNGDAALNDDIIFSYTFRFEDDEIKYEYVLNSKGDLCQEALFLNQALVYSIHFYSLVGNFDGLDNLREGEIIHERYWGAVIKEKPENMSLPFLRWLLTNVPLNNTTHLASLGSYIDNMILVSGNDRNGQIGKLRDADSFYQALGEDESELKTFERYLNEMGIPCALKTKRLPDGNYELYFKHKRVVPFRTTASSGTIALTNLYMRVFSWEKNPSFLYLDEYDAFYHYEMSESMLRFLKESYPQTQIILTTHNTNLMSCHLMRPDNIMILSQRGRLTSLSHATTRELREGHNLEKLYIGGEFEEFE